MCLEAVLSRISHSGKMCFSGGSFKDRSCGKDVFSRGAFKDKQFMEDLFIAECLQ